MIPILNSLAAAANPLFKGEAIYIPFALNKFYELHPPEPFHKYVFGQLKDGEIPFGGYMENREVYQQSHVFQENGRARSLHLGVDFWAPVETVICSPLDGIVVGKKDNAGIGNYGGTLIVKHTYTDGSFYTLYGHLEIESIPWNSGDVVKAGQEVGHLGGLQSNGYWPPHLHFQIITTLNEEKIDFPGVCFPEEKDKFLDLCPDPNYLLQYESEV
ncbi:MAG: murein DD-endopeptidase MepM/ murein hydrolase activator NlpD [Luteibaculaceae bacterium]|jgi:murein DD-endopeptidase MepM/ murein hydrolase activator NlpD